MSGKDWGLEYNADSIRLGRDIDIRCGTGAIASAPSHPSGLHWGEFNVDPREDGMLTYQYERNKKNVQRQVIWESLALVIYPTAAVVAAVMTQRENRPDPLLESSTSSGLTGYPHRLPTVSPVAPKMAPDSSNSSLTDPTVAPTIDGNYLSYVNTDLG